MPRACDPGGWRWRLGLILLGAALWGCGSGQPAPAAAPRAITVAVDATLMPMAFLEDGGLKGFEVDLIREVAAAAGLELRLVNVEWAGLFGGLITGKHDAVISSVTIMEERKQRMAFSIPYLRSGLALVARRGRDDIRSFDDVKALGLTIGAQTGTTAHFFLDKDPGARKKIYQQYGHAIADLLNGEIGAVLGESSGVLYYQARNKDFAQKVRRVGDIMTEEYYGIVLRQGETALLEKINAALAQLLRSGAAQKLHAKWELGEAAAVPALPVEAAAK